MSIHDDPDLQLLERDLRQLAEPRAEDELLRQALRTQLVGELRPRPRRRPRVRIAAGGLTAVGAAAAIALVALVGSTGSGGPSVADAAIIHHALGAVTAPAGEILHTKLVSTENGTTFVASIWRQTAPPYAGRGSKGPLGAQQEFSYSGATYSEYDPATNTIYEHVFPSPPRAPDDSVSRVRQELASGQAQVDGTVVVDGASLYKIDLRAGLVGYFDTTTYALRYVDAAQPNGTVARERVDVYEYLPMTSANQKLLSVTAQHPGARIDTKPSDAPAS